LGKKRGSNLIKERAAKTAQKRGGSPSGKKRHKRGFLAKALQQLQDRNIGAEEKRSFGKPERKKPNNVEKPRNRVKKREIQRGDLRGAAPFYTSRPKKKDECDWDEAPRNCKCP